MMNKKTALMIIDMQKGMSWPQAGKRNNPNAENEIVALLTAWRRELNPIVHVCHHSTDPDSLFWPKQDGVLFQPAFEPFEQEKVITKSVPDAFTHSGLDAWLRQNTIEQILVMGVSTNNSVESTVRSAGNLGFTTYVVESACFAFSKSDFYGKKRSAEDVHAMSLANLHGEYATVISYQEGMGLLSMGY